MTHGNPLLQLKALGQSVWLDDIRRGWLEDGTLARMIEQDGLCGVTSNPAIFKKSIGETHDYDGEIADTADADPDIDASTVYEDLVIEDVQQAAEQLHRVYKESHHRDGFVSLEVSPHLAHDTEETFIEAVRLWTEVDCPNLIIKVPATRAGLPAIRRLIAAGINVNVTLIFSVERYLEVADAYMTGLEVYAATDKPLGHIASVASFFVSRIDTLVDKQLDALGTPLAHALRGKSAIASARLAYQAYKEIIASPRWQALVAQGAMPQRLLWGSTGTKDKRYSDVKYVEALIGADTIDTMPLTTLNAFREHGIAAAHLEDDLEAAQTLPAQLAALGINLAGVSEQLEEEGVRKFVQPYDQLLATLDTAIRTRSGHTV
jgi:transaldolase